MLVTRVVVRPCARMICGLMMVVHCVHVEMSARLSRPQLGLQAGAADRAQHGSGHRSPDWEQYGKQQQEPETDDLHNQSRGRHLFKRDARTRGAC